MLSLVRIVIWILQQIQLKQRFRRQPASRGSSIQRLTVCDKFRRRERCESAILSPWRPICNTALALFAPWCSCTRSTFADSFTLGG